MSILDQFLILFETNADEAKADVKNLNEQLDHTEKKSKHTDASIRKLGGSFLGLATQIGGTIAVLLSVQSLISGFTNTVNTADSLNKLSQSLGISVEELDIWSNTAKAAGGTAEGFQGSITNLTSAMAQMDTVGKSRVAPFFKQLGISLLDTKGKVRPVLDLLPELAKAFEGMSKQESFGIGQKLGLDQGTIMLLQRGGRELDDMIKRQKELGVITKEDAEIAGKFKDVWDDTGHVMRTVFMGIASMVLPTLGWFLEKIQAAIIWGNTHKDQLKTLGITIAIVAGIITALYIPAMVAAAAATIAANLPLIALATVIAAVGAAIYFLVEDIIAFTKGQDSLIGNILNRFPILIDFFKEFINVCKELWSWVGKIVDGVAKIFGGKDEKIVKSVIEGKNALSNADSTPLSSQTTNSIQSKAFSNKTSNVQIGEINVQTQATDANGISNQIGKSLTNQMRQANSNYDDGVLA